MNKNQKELIILLLLVACVINYTFYNFYLADRLHILKGKKEIYIQSRNNLDYIKNESEHSSDISSQINKLKSQASAVDEKIPEYIDTPQLVYDFYTSCRNYKVQGESISFQLPGGNKNSNGQKSTGNNSSSISGLKTLAIQLNLTGSKENIEYFIKNLNNITKRKINVNSISLNFSGASSDDLSAVIIFNQYVQTDNRGNLNIPADTASEYSFYKGPKPYSSITDMLQNGAK